MLGVGLSLTGQLKSSVLTFSPISLFSAGEQGIWLDPSDLSTMFQDRAGTTPVTAPGQTVGLRLDKSKGLVLGSELVTNGDFAAGSTGWTITAPGTNTITISSGSVRFVTNGSADAATLNQPWSGATAVGKYYRITFNVLSGSTGQLKISTLGVSTVIGEHTFTATPGAKSFTLVSSNTINIGISRVVGQSADATIDNISVKELPGNHAVAPTDAARPTYGIEPKIGRRNLLTRTEEFGDAVWVKSFTSIAANTIAAPDGTMTADKILELTDTGNHSVLNTASVYPAGVYTATVYAKAAERTWVLFSGIGANSFNAYFNLSGAGSVGTVASGTTASISALSDGWFRLSVTKTFAAPTASGSTGVFLATGDGSISYAGTAGSGIYLWGAQLELGSTATAYQRVGTAFDVTEAGVPTVHYVQYDGTDDSFSTSSINFTATDKMSMFAGVNKLGTTSYPVFAELGTSSSIGGFIWHANGVTSNVAYFANYASPTATAFFSDGGINQPYVGALLLDRAGTSGALSEIAFRKNTVAISGTQDGANPNSTGNYGNLALFIGRRNNASLPFNGRDYGIIVVGKAASATEITNTESYLAANTSGVTL